MNQLVNRLKFDYETVCYEIVKRFEKKHGYQFDGWVAGDVGGIADFIGQYYFNLQGMAFDVFTGQKKGFIFEWQDYLIDNQDKEYKINFQSYCKGARY